MLPLNGVTPNITSKVQADFTSEKPSSSGCIGYKVLNWISSGLYTSIHAHKTIYTYDWTSLRVCDELACESVWKSKTKSSQGDNFQRKLVSLTSKDDISLDLNRFGLLFLDCYGKHRSTSKSISYWTQF